MISWPVESVQKLLTRSHRTILLLLFMTFNVAAQEIGKVERRLPNSEAPLEQVLEWSTKEGQPYWYRLPAKKNASKNLLIMLHGTGLNHGWAIWNYGVASGEFRPGDIIVSPEGLTPGGNTFNFTLTKANGEQIAGLIRSFKNEFEIERVYIYGHSQGAFFSYWFQGSYPELVDGIIAHAGNLLAQVPHPSLAKEKIAIAILHGRADAVVGVECAFSTEKALRELGYQKLKLEIVEGLNAQSGHWPLPAQVNSLLAWLDQICSKDGASAVAVFENALEAESPDLSDLIHFERATEAALKKYRGKDKSELKDRFDAASQSLESRMTGLLEVLAAIDPRAREDSPETALFRISADIIKERASAKKALRQQLAAAKAQNKEIENCLELLYRKVDVKSLKLAVKVLGNNLLGSSRIELARFLASSLTEPATDLDKEVVAGIKSEIDQIRKLEAEQQLRLQKLLASRTAVDESPETKPEVPH